MPARERAELLGREPLGAFVGGVAKFDERRPRALAHVRAPVAGRERERARERLAPVCERAMHHRAQLGIGTGRRRRSPSSTESTFGTGRNTVREMGRSTFTSQASWDNTEGTP